MSENLFKLEELSNTAKGLASVALAIAQAMSKGDHTPETYVDAVDYYVRFIGDFAEELNATANSMRKGGEKQ